MSFDERLAGRPRVEERRMFGGLAFLSGGKMFCGILGRDLVVRVGPDAYEEALRRAHVRPMDFTGRPMRGYVYVSPRGTATRRTLPSWLERALKFVSTLPPRRRATLNPGARRQD